MVAVEGTKVRELPYRQSITAILPASSKCSASLEDGCSACFALRMAE